MSFLFPFFTPSFILLPGLVELQTRIITICSLVPLLQAQMSTRGLTISVSSNEPEVGCVPNSPSSGTRKRRSKSLSRTQHPPPVRLHCFWASSTQEMPIYHCSPWDFYKPFLTLDEERMLVLCNHNTIVRVVRNCPCPTSTLPHNILQVQHRNFIDYYEAYFFKGQVFTVSENIDYSLKEMLENGLYPTEREIAYMVGQVSQDLFEMNYKLVLIVQILAGIRFIESRKIGDSTLSGRTVRISREGKVKIGTSHLNANRLG